MSNTLKVLDPAFQGVGQRLGTEIWRIENFQPVPLPKSEYGKFYMGDSYIILQRIEVQQGKKGVFIEYPPPKPDQMFVGQEEEDTTVSSLKKSRV